MPLAPCCIQQYQINFPSIAGSAHDFGGPQRRIKHAVCLNQHPTYAAWRVHPFTYFVPNAHENTETVPLHETSLQSTRMTFIKYRRYWMAQFPCDINFEFVSQRAWVPLTAVCVPLYSIPPQTCRKLSSSVASWECLPPDPISMHKHQQHRVYQHLLLWPNVANSTCTKIVPFRKIVAWDYTMTGV